MQSNNKVVAIIEARMGSSRLPGKHLLKANNKPMLQHLIERLSRARSVDQVVVAITENALDDELEAFLKSLDVNYYRGSEDDVMGRVIKAAESVSADIICEVTGDCPVIDPLLVDQVVNTFNINDNAVYVNNGKYAKLPAGMNAQVFYLETLKKSYSMTDNELDREHVTLHIKRNPELFPPIYLVATQNLMFPELELTLDEHDDYIFIKKIIEHFGDENSDFTCEDIVHLIKQKPDWLKINEKVQRKGES